MKAEEIRSLVENRIEGTGIFLVEVAVRPGNTVRVLLDRPGGISIDECVAISKNLHSELDRDVEDYSLEVSSPGVGTPFRVKQQYDNSVGRDLEIVMTDGNRLAGRLVRVEGSEIVLTVNEKERRVAFDEIKSAKENISFN